MVLPSFVRSVTTAFLYHQSSQVAVIKISNQSHQTVSALSLSNTDTNPVCLQPLEPLEFPPPSSVQHISGYVDLCDHVDSIVQPSEGNYQGACQWQCCFSGCISIRGGGGQWTVGCLASPSVMSFSYSLPLPTQAKHHSPILWVLVDASTALAWLQPPPIEILYCQSLRAEAQIDVLD